MIFVEIDYTNHAGVRRKRMIKPIKIVYMTTPHHPEAQWCLVAQDVEKGPRTFAMKDIHSWRPV